MAICRCSNIRRATPASARLLLPNSHRPNDDLQAVCIIDAQVLQFAAHQFSVVAHVGYGICIRTAISM
jgi:hypothetical protein